MIRPYPSSRASLVLFAAPSRRQRLARRRLTTVAVVLGLATASALLGALTRDNGPPARSAAFSYFPNS